MWTVVKGSSSISTLTLTRPEFPPGCGQGCFLECRFDHVPSLPPSRVRILLSPLVSGCKTQMFLPPQPLLPPSLQCCLFQAFLSPWFWPCALWTSPLSQHALPAKPASLPLGLSCVLLRSLPDSQRRPAHCWFFCPSVPLSGVLISAVMSSQLNHKSLDSGDWLSLCSLLDPSCTPPTWWAVGGQKIFKGRKGNHQLASYSPPASLPPFPMDLVPCWDICPWSTDMITSLPCAKTFKGSPFPIEYNPQSLLSPPWTGPSCISKLVSPGPLVLAP